VAASQGPPGSDTPSQKRLGFGIPDLGIVVSIAGGIAGLVYILGGAVLGIRLSLYGLPTEAVVVQVPQWTMLTVGLTEVVLPTVSIVGSFAVWRLILRGGLLHDGLRHLAKARGRSLNIPLWVDLVLETFVMAWLTYFVFFVSRGGSFTGVEAPPPQSLPAFPGPSYEFGVVSLIIVVFTAIVFASLIACRYVKSLADGADMTKMIIVVAASTLVLMTLFAMTRPLLDIKVCRKSIAGEVEVTGWLVATSSDRLYIGESNVRESRYVQALPLSDATEVFISGNARNAICTP
jgi:hypothetical protein